MSASTLTRPQASGAAPRRRTRVVEGTPWRRRSPLVFVADHALLIALAVMFVAPFVFVLLTAVMSPEQAGTSFSWPTSWHWDNFAQVFEKLPMLKYFGNSFLYAGLATLFMLVSSVPAGYALARIRFRGSRLYFFAIIAMMLLPPQVTSVPLYVMWSRLGLTGSLWPLILPNLLGDAFSIFLLRQFFLTIPAEYSEAARIDGCGELRTLWRVILPMARPGIAATSIFLFFASWNDYYGPLLYTSENESAWPVSYALAQFRGSRSVDWNLTMAATLIAMVPVVLVFLLAQRAFVRGVTLTGVKG
ncbi:carbohydrate ABC transporter permease [Cellulomonas alba]|uniref:Carbohydrate ABC transporter permease n=1 Tax=Cellulomonas alba TaxID=3053467 RepID=A0ABT7SGF4_9CELL|nr:carbohydrate ABC transporter permease [Cellulomonas alba]MDM7855255.1 carbohydrate ABC transporter permease [Cellulomonas alba]